LKVNEALKIIHCVVKCAKFLRLFMRLDLLLNCIISNRENNLD